MSKRHVFAREFEGLDVLDELLSIADAKLNARAVVDRFKDAQERKEEAQRVIPTLFNEEPRFPDPEYARLLYQNLLGLWDAIEAGEPLEEKKADRPKREKKKKLEPPPPFEAHGPDTEWVEGALRYLQHLDEREMDRLVHSFENRQDALLQYLEEQQLSEEAWGTARSLLFELFAFIELGHAGGVRNLVRADFDAAEKASSDVPEALRMYAEEVLQEVETDDEAPLPKDEVAKLNGVVRKALRALWVARKTNRQG